LPLLGGGGEVVGSAKLGTPCERMQRASASSWSFPLSDDPDWPSGGCASFAQACWAALSAGDCGLMSLGMASPACAVGSGKLGTPCARMHRAYSSSGPPSDAAPAGRLGEPHAASSAAEMTAEAVSDRQALRAARAPGVRLSLLALSVTYPAVVWAPLLRGRNAGRYTAVTPFAGSSELMPGASSRLIERIGAVSPARSVRLRLTALYAALFLLCGAGLLTITYLLVSRATRVDAVAVSSPGAAGARGAVSQTHLVDLHQLLVQSGIALAIMAVVSGVLGWVVAGRVLSPLRTITARTRRISEESLHDRLSLTGPRDELKELADTIDELLARLEAAFDAQRRFVANASHELRTPLAMMRTTLDVAMAKPGGVPAQTASLDANLRADLDRADGLLESFLTLAQAQHGALDVRPVRLDQLLTEALVARRDRIAEQRIEVHAVLEPVSVNGSETLLGRMVENVIENAVLHNHPEGFITLACGVEAGLARAVIESGGAVLDERTVAQLAQPFRRMGADRTRSKPGFGLGLSIVAAVAAAHDGTLELHARREGGLNVHMAFPAATPAPLDMVSV
jgi:signal transduction histidine kinase